MNHRHRSATATILSVALMALLGGALVAQGQAVDTGDGEALFALHCAACHQPNGEGIPTVFPPLAGHVPELLAVEGGRTYPILVVHYGLAGPIEVHGTAYDGLMPPLQALGDQEIADILNYVATAWGNAEELDPEFVPYAPEEVAAERDRALTMADVHELRQALPLE
jgi:mono/diheme cytochrome c family protein